MKTEKRYFTVREAHDEQRHIGTIAVDIRIDADPHYHIGNKEEANKQLSEAVERALTEHFDEECILVKVLDIQNYMGTDPHTEAFTFTYGGDVEPHEDQFEIEQTWLY